jgi:hypothetical protein
MMRSKTSGSEAKKGSSWLGLSLAVTSGVFVLIILWLLSDDLRNATFKLMSSGFHANPSAVEKKTVFISSPPLVTTSSTDVKPPPLGNQTLLAKVKDRATQQMVEIYDKPIPEDCYAEAHADYDGDAVRWGLGNKASSAAECCQQCKDHKKGGKPCNIWVWCGDPSGECWTMDIHEHTTGDCWLKHQAGLKPDRSNLKINHKGKFSQEFKREHKTAPDLIPWTAGVIP